MSWSAIRCADCAEQRLLASLALSGAQSLLADVPRCFRFSRREERHHVGHVAAAHHDAAAVRREQGRRVVRDGSVGSDGRLAVLAATAQELPEVHALEDGRLRRLTNHNDAWLRDVRLATVEDFTTKAKDGTTVNGLVYKPPAFAAGTKYPVDSSPSGFAMRSVTKRSSGMPETTSTMRPATSTETP